MLYEGFSNNFFEKSGFNNNIIHEFINFIFKRQKKNLKLSKKSITLNKSKRPKSLHSNPYNTC